MKCQFVSTELMCKQNEKSKQGHVVLTRLVIFFRLTNMDDDFKQARKDLLNIHK